MSKLIIRCHFCKEDMASLRELGKHWCLGKAKVVLIDQSLIFTVPEIKAAIEANQKEGQ